MRNTRLLVGAMALLLAAAGCVDEVTQPQVEVEPELGILGSNGRPDFKLTVLHSNDGESDLLPGPDYGGVARFGRTVSDLRAAAIEDCEIECGVILLSSGDNFLAGPEFNASLEGGTFYDALAQDLIGYDASAIGNHEFDFGPDVLAAYIGAFEETETPFLSANLDVGGEPGLAALEGRGRIAASTVIEVEVTSDDDDKRPRGRARGWERRRGRRDDVVRIGVIGATTPELRTISSPRNVEVLQNVARRVNREVFRLRSRGVDKIILISHLQGLEGVNGDLELISRLFGIDLAIAGGGDELLANADDDLDPADAGGVFGAYPLVARDRRGRDVPVITTSGSYKYVGRLEVLFSRQGTVLSSEGGPVLVQGAADPTLEALVEAPVAAAVETLNQSVVGVSQVPLDGVRGSVRTLETNQGNLIADALRWQAGELATSFGVPTPDVAIQNGGGIRNDAVVPAGTLTELEVFGWVPFPNFVTVVPGISRDHFKQILERAVSAVEFTSGRFAQVSGFSFTYDPAGAAQEQDADGNVTVAGSRIVDVTLYDGTQLVVGGQVQAGADLTVATVDFLARGGDGYPYAGAPFTTVGVTYQQAVSNYIADALGGVVSGADYPVGGEGRIIAN